MKHFKAIFYKFLMIAIVLEIVLNLLTHLNFWQILVVSATVTVVAYIIGDLAVLGASNNTIATLADFGLAWLTIYAFNYYYRTAGISITDAFIAAAVIGVGEWLFHKYAASNVFPG